MKENNNGNNECGKSTTNCTTTDTNSGSILGASRNTTNASNSGVCSASSDSKTKFLKFDSAKPRFDLVDPWFSEDTAKVLTMGAMKYAEDNWKLNTDIKRYIGALERHLNEIKKGELFDTESTLQHTAHIACNAMFLHYMIRKGTNGKRKNRR